MKTTLGQRIKARRKDLGLSQGKLGELAGLDQTVISKLERGDVQETSRIAELASVLRCDALWLATGKAESGNVSNVAHSAANRVPLISFVAAGNWGDAVDNYAPGDAEA